MDTVERSKPQPDKYLENKTQSLVWYICTCRRRKNSLKPLLHPTVATPPNAKPPSSGEIVCISLRRENGKVSNRYTPAQLTKGSK